MKIKWGALVVDGRGKLGGHVASKNRGGAYMRTKVTPVNPQSTFQTVVRALFGSISSAWSGLTNAERQSFYNRTSSYQTTDIFGDSKVPSGKALFQRLNQNLGNSEQALITVCPAPKAVPSALITDFAAIATGQAMSFQTTEDTTGNVLMIFATPPLSAGTEFYKNELRHIGNIAGSAPDPVEIGALYSARYGAFAAGDHIFAGVKVCNDGGLTSPLEVLEAVVGA